MERVRMFIKILISFYILWTGQNGGFAFASGLLCPKNDTLMYTEECPDGLQPLNATDYATVCDPSLQTNGTTESNGTRSSNSTLNQDVYFCWCPNCTTTCTTTNKTEEVLNACENCGCEDIVDPDEEKNKKDSSDDSSDDDKLMYIIGGAVGAVVLITVIVVIIVCVVLKRRRGTDGPGIFHKKTSNQTGDFPLDDDVVLKGKIQERRSKKEDRGSYPYSPDPTVKAQESKDSEDLEDLPSQLAPPPPCSPQDEYLAMGPGHQTYDAPSQRSVESPQTYEPLNLREDAEYANTSAQKPEAANNEPIEEPMYGNQITIFAASMRGQNPLVEEDVYLNNEEAVARSQAGANDDANDDANGDANMEPVEEDVYLNDGVQVSGGNHTTNDAEYAEEDVYLNESQGAAETGDKEPVEEDIYLNEKPDEQEPEEDQLYMNYN